MNGAIELVDASVCQKGDDRDLVVLTIACVTNIGVDPWWACLR